MSRRSTSARETRQRIAAIGRRFWARLPARETRHRTLAIGRRFWTRLEGRLRARHAIVFHEHSQFEHKARAFADLLSRRGVPTRVRSGLSSYTRAQLQASDDLWIGFWNEVPLGLLPKRYIVVNAEPINLKWARHDIGTVLEVMKNAREVWGYLASNAVLVEKLGVPFQFVPFGYAPYYESIFRENTAGKELARDIDVLFFGSLSERRRQILDEIRKRGMKVHVVYEGAHAFGAKLDELLARASIVLGIHYYEEPVAQIADLARLDHLLSNRVFVIHERPAACVADPEFERNVTTSAYADLPDACAHFLAHPDKRARKAAAAHEWFKSTYALDDFIPYERVHALLREG